MKLNAKQFKDKVYACWIGKNIGGTMGAPYEGKNDIQDIQGFITKPGEIIPNDDLDLQLAWLAAVEHGGISGITPQRLGEYWLSYIGPYWNEYGLGKVNMKLGMIPPLSGDHLNDWKHSNGAWIRTEIWASMEPCRPDFAARYACYDACVDHGTGEGTYAAVFVAAMQSTAFAVSDIRSCIEVGLSKIPASSRVAQSVRLTMDCYEKGVPYRETRDIIQKSNADIGNGWFEAPSNVAYTVLGLLYGEGDFKKSMIYAINCGDDTDCTGATVGATLGILGGTAAIPKDWRAHIGDGISTVAVDRGTLGNIPKTCTELTERVVNQARVALATDYIGATRVSGYQHGIQLTAGETDLGTDEESFVRELMACQDIRTFMERELLPNSFEVNFEFARAVVSLDGGNDIAPNGEKKLHVRLFNNIEWTGAIPYRLSLRWILPDGFTVTGARFAPLDRPERHGTGTADLDYVITAGGTVADKNRCILEIMADGRLSSGYLPVVLLGQ